MSPQSFLRSGFVCVIAFVFCGAIVSGFAPLGKSTVAAGDEQPGGAVPRIAEKDRVTVAVARDRATVMHDVYAATLDVMHHHYFQREKAVLPARAMEDIFAEIKQKSRADARWISVNLKAMSINHEPKSEFEKSAAKEIAAGKAEVEIIEEGYYRRVGAIPLGDGCISCHGGIFREGSKTPRFAGLVISIPVRSDPPESK